MGTTPGANNLYGSGDISATSATPTNLPTNGETIYVELITNYYPNTQVSNSYTYKASATAAAISSPTPSTTLAGSSVKFTWNAVPGVYFYNLRVGTTPGANNLYGSGDISATSATPTNLPTNGETIYVELITDYYPATQVSNSYTYKASATAAAISSPTPSTTLAGSSVQVHLERRPRGLLLQPSRGNHAGCEQPLRFRRYIRHLRHAHQLCPPTARPSMSS